MKKGILTRIFGGGRLAVPLALAAVSSAAQTPLERELLSSGFENVRQLKGETGSYVFLEPVPFRSMRDAVDAVTGRIGAAGDSAGGPMTVVWTEDRIPKFVLETGGYPDSVRWRLDFDTRDAREAWKRSLTSRPGAKRFLRSSAGRVDLILYPQFRFRNSRLDVMYEVQINLNPTLEELADIKTAVSEAVTNAIIHGYENLSGYTKHGEMRPAYSIIHPGKVRLHCILENDTLSIEVSDQGKGIEDVARAMEPLFTTKPELERSGMGFAFMEAFMDELEVESIPGKGTRVHMWKKMRCGDWIGKED